jgi:hypothetical protein
MNDFPIISLLEENKGYSAGLYFFIFILVTHGDTVGNFR